MRYQIKIGEKTYELQVENEQPQLQVYYQGKPVSFDYQKIHDPGLYSLIIDGRQFRVWLNRRGDGNYRIDINHAVMESAVADERQMLRKSLRSAQKEKTGVVQIRAPMPGLIRRVEVDSDQEVDAGDGLAVVEAMKMENEIRSPVPGKVKKIHVKQGDAIEKDAVLIEITEEE